MGRRRASSPFPLDLEPGREISGRYRIEAKLGEGWEGEVYKVAELRTGIERVAKFYFPERNPQGRAATAYARRLHALKSCSIVTQYHHQDWLRIRRGGEQHQVEYLVSEFAEGEVLAAFQARLPGKRFQAFEALHMIHALAVGVQEIHRAGQYHGDIHSENILVRRRGIFFQVKLLDFFDLGRPTRAKRQDDLVDLAHLLHEMIGGVQHYRRQPPLVKRVCAGRRRDLILERFSSATELVEALESWRESD